MGLSYQIRHSVQSIPANIAEGHGRYYYQDNVRFCYIARGSLEELLSHLVLAHDLGYLQNELFEGLAQQGKSLARLINGYISYLKGSIQGANEPGFDWGLHEPLDEYLTNSTDDIDDSQFSTLDSQGDIE